ncbi:MAG: DUF4160 domain-containing protein [Alphaproteobacteria bacterium]
MVGNARDQNYSRTALCGVSRSHVCKRRSFLHRKSNIGCYIIKDNTTCHRPAHVHVIGKGCEAVFELNCPEGSPELRENYGFNTSDLSRIRTALAVRATHLCEEWSRIYG